MGHGWKGYTTTICIGAVDVVKESEAFGQIAARILEFQRLTANGGFIPFVKLGPALAGRPLEAESCLEFSRWEIVIGGTQTNHPSTTFLLGKLLYTLLFLPNPCIGLPETATRYLRGRSS